jgi:hypothetical protein
MICAALVRGDVPYHLMVCSCNAKNGDQVCCQGVLIEVTAMFPMLLAVEQTPSNVEKSPPLAEAEESAKTILTSTPSMIGMTPRRWHNWPPEPPGGISSPLLSCGY